MLDVVTQKLIDIELKFINFLLGICFLLAKKCYLSVLLASKAWVSFILSNNGV